MFFQPHLLPHLIGKTWLFMVLVTVATMFSKNLPSQVKWPLAGLGITNALLMLGDAIVPATKILLSHHEAYFLHTTVAVLLTFVISAALGQFPRHAPKLQVTVAVATCLILLGGVLEAVGTYRSALPLLRQQAELTRLFDSWGPGADSLVIGKSKIVDDSCGWAVLLSKGPVLYCTDAETMLTPEQNRTIQRFREAVYLYFAGKNSADLRNLSTAPDYREVLYQLGFWAEATSLSETDHRMGLHSVDTDLVPVMEQAENHDMAIAAFLHRFRNIAVVDEAKNPAFSRSRLASYLTLKGERQSGNWVLLTYEPNP